MEVFFFFFSLKKHSKKSWLFRPRQIANSPPSAFSARTQWSARVRPTANSSRSTGTTTSTELARSRRSASMTPLARSVCRPRRNRVYRWNGRMSLSRRTRKRRGTGSIFRATCSRRRITRAGVPRKTPMPRRSTETPPCVRPWWMSCKCQRFRRNCAMSWKMIDVIVNDWLIDWLLGFRLIDWLIDWVIFRVGISSFLL